jgi:hypothetical protein
LDSGHSQSAARTLLASQDRSLFPASTRFPLTVPLRDFSAFQPVIQLKEPIWPPDTELAERKLKVAFR